MTREEAISKLYELIENKRVEVLEINDDIRRNDIRDVQYQIAHIKEKNK